jgi:hypothetical protein
VEDFGSENGGKQVILKHSAGRLLPWTMSESWSRSGELTSIYTSDISAFNAAEIAFNVDFNGDEGIGTGLSLTPIESNGVVLNQDSVGNLYADNEPLYISATTPLKTDSFTRYSISAVEDFGENGGKLVVLKHDSGALKIWTMSDTWVRDGELPWVYQSNVDAFNQAEADYASDFDGDQDVSLIEIETSGTNLKRDLTGRLYANNEPLYITAATPLKADSFTRYSISAVEDFGENGGKRVVLKHDSGALKIWTMSDTWVRDGELPWVYQSNVDAFNQAEADYASDFDSDGLTGLVLTPIEQSGTILNQDALGRLYANETLLRVNASTPVTTNSFTRYSISAVEDFGDNGGKQLALIHDSGSIKIWTMDNSWVRNDELPWIYVSDISGFGSTELAFNFDFNDDEIIG